MDFNKTWGCSLQLELQHFSHQTFKMSVQALSQQQLTAALSQLVSAPNFNACNPHLSAQQRAGITSGQWPNCPVFTPYAITHHGYSQSTKYLMHRVTYQQANGDLGVKDDVSHIMYLGKNTSKNINPLHLVKEVNLVNQTRKCCALYLEEMLFKWEIGAVGLASWNDADFVAWVVGSNVACQVVHRDRPCTCDPKFWEELSSLDDLTNF